MSKRKVVKFNTIARYGYPGCPAVLNTWRRLPGFKSGDRVRVTVQKIEEQHGKKPQNKSR